MTETIKNIETKIPDTEKQLENLLAKVENDSSEIHSMEWIWERFAWFDNTNKTEFLQKCNKIFCKDEKIAEKWDFLKTLEKYGAIV